MPKGKDTGGPAFPGPFTGHCGNENHASPCGCYLDSGMSLRDWFAGKFSQGLANGIVERGSGSMPWVKIAFNDTAAKQCAEIAYRMADAMLEERKR